MGENRLNPEEMVTLNVGGTLFTASRDVLLRYEDCYFHALLGCSCCKPDQNGTYFINRDPTYFNRIMGSLRSGKPVDHDGLSLSQIDELRVELDYYQLPPRARWDTKRCGEELVITEEGRTVTKTANTHFLYSGVLMSDPDIPSFQVCIRKMVDTVAIGYTKCGLCGRDDPHVMGWFVLTDGRALLGQKEVHHYCPKLKEGDVVKVDLDKPSSTIKFAVNGTHHGCCHCRGAPCNLCFFP